METKLHLELAIRTAMLVKSLSQLVGTTDPVLARFMFAEAADEFAALGTFINSVQPKAKPSTSSERP